MREDILFGFWQKKKKKNRTRCLVSTFCSTEPFCSAQPDIFVSFLKKLKIAVLVGWTVREKISDSGVWYSYWFALRFLAPSLRSAIKNELRFRWYFVQRNKMSHHMDIWYVMYVEWHIITLSLWKYYLNKCLQVFMNIYINIYICPCITYIHNVFNMHLYVK